MSSFDPSYYTRQLLRATVGFLREKVRMEDEAQKKTVENDKKDDGADDQTGVCSSGARPKTSTSAGRQTRRMEMYTKKINKKAAKMEQKDTRNYDNVMKLIAPLSIEEKFEYLCEKYRELYQEVRKLEIVQIRYNQLQADHEQLNSDYTKNLTIRSRLESLCRDLQKQNKDIKEDTAQRLREEEQKRKEVSDKFQKNFDDLTNLMEEGNKKSLKLREDNHEMAKRIEVLKGKSKQLEEQMNLMHRESQLEKQLHESNLAKMRLETQMAKEEWEQERRAMELNLRKSEEVRVQLQMNSKVLQEQIQLYVKKCEDCEKTIKRSNKMFEKCKAETHGVTKKMVAMENDAKIWKKEWLKRDEEAETGKRKIGQLEKLCRQLQAERNEFLKLLRANNIPIPSVNVTDNQQTLELPPAPPIATAKERELVVLKNKLAELQDDLKVLGDDAKVGAVIEHGKQGASSVENGGAPAVATESTENADVIQK